MSIAGQAPETVQNAIQNFGTAGIKPLTRPSLIIRVFMGVVAWVERLNLKYSKVGNPPIYVPGSGKSSASGAWSAAS